MAPEPFGTPGPVPQKEWSSASDRRARAFPQNHQSPAPPGLVGLEGLYERYCDRQARDLLQLIPRGGLRALAKRARQEATVGEGAEEGLHDPLARVVRMARRLLPLPPYAVWIRSYLADRRPFLEALGIEAAPARREPVLVDVRSLPGGWTAGLHLFKREGGWRGFLQFRKGVEEGEVYRTAEIFRGGAPEEIRERFKAYRPATLDAFLRSSRP